MPEQRVGHGQSSWRPGTQNLARLAQDKGVVLPSDVDAKHKRLHERLSKLSGADFDREYMKAMAGDHDSDVKAFQRQATRPFARPRRSRTGATRALKRATVRAADIP